jgi:hypothetical protein
MLKVVTLIVTGDPGGLRNGKLPRQAHSHAVKTGNTIDHRNRMPVIDIIPFTIESKASRRGTARR